MSRQCAQRPDRLRFAIDKIVQLVRACLNSQMSCTLNRRRRGLGMRLLPPILHTLPLVRADNCSRERQRLRALSAAQPLDAVGSPLPPLPPMSRRLAATDRPVQQTRPAPRTNASCTLVMRTSTRRLAGASRRHHPLRHRSERARQRCACSCSRQAQPGRAGREAPPPRSGGLRWRHPTNFRVLLPCFRARDALVCGLGTPLVRAPRCSVGCSGVKSLESERRSVSCEKRNSC